MPHRRCRKSAAIFLCGMMCLFLWQASIYPVQGQWSKRGGEINNAKDKALKSTAVETTKLIVQRGETLWGLAQRYRTTVDEIARLNHMQSTSQIRAGESLRVPNGETKEKTENPVNIYRLSEYQIPTYEVIVNNDAQSVDKPSKSTIPGNKGDGQKRVTQKEVPLEIESQILSRSLGRLVSKEDVELITRVIYGEARGEDFEGQVAVGAVVLNRLKDPRFPKTIRSVIYQAGAFTAVDDRQIHLEPDDEAYKAAEAALSGLDPTNGAIYYYNPRIATDRWIKSRPVIKRIGNHTFSI